MSVQVKHEYTVEYFLVLNSNKLLIHTATWMNFENMLIERSQSKQSNVLWSHLHQMSRIGKSIDKESRLVIDKSLEEGGIGCDY